MLLPCDTGPLTAVSDMVADTTHSIADGPARAIHQVSDNPSQFATHKVAVDLLDGINRFLDAIGLGGSELAQEIIYICIIAVIALITGWIIKTVLLGVTRYIVKKRNSQAAHELITQRVLAHCAHVVPPLVFMAFLPFAFNYSNTLLWTIMRIAGVYTLIAFAFGINSIIAFGFTRYNRRHNSRNIPLTGILNVARGVVWIIVLILCVAILIGKSPAGILAGLGAFAAALMLIFKDSILGFTAGIQMAENDMIHVGDWIVVPGTPANGTVLDMTLTTVKIQNFDNTIVTVPPYTLVSGAFRNWRGMSESGVRNINQNFTIDYQGVAPLSRDLLDSVLAKYPLLQPYVQQIHDAGGDRWLVQGNLRLANGTLETNLGLLRLYLCAYLLDNPHISNNHRVLVQVVENTIYGIQMSIWCWANTTDWNAYESIMSGVMEHIATVVSDFGLALYNAGSDTITLENGTSGVPAKQGA